MLSIINPNVPFSLYADCYVEYVGRAYSTLEKGRYLLLHKSDGSFLVHGSLFCKANNYQGAGSIITLENNKLICKNKKESIIATVDHIISYAELHDWSSAKPNISRTEKDLVNKLHDNWNTYFPDECVAIHKEYKTSLGDVDILGLTISGRRIVVEVKRRKVVIKDCTQLRRYVEFFSDAGITDITGWLASPDISKSALKYLEKHGLYWTAVQFD